MPIQVVCPGCGQVHAVPDEWAGKTVRCRHCETQHAVLPADVAGNPPAPQAGQPSPEYPPPELAAVASFDAVGTQTLTSAPSPQGSQARAFLGMMDQVFAGMGQALSLRKLGFFLLAALAGMMVWAILVGTGFAIGPKTGIGMLVLADLFAIGLSGVIAGGVAHLTVEEGLGRVCGFVDTLTFCGQRFVALFCGALLLAVGVGLVALLVNGLIAVFNLSRTVGSLLGSLVFLPQFLVNAALVVLCLVGVLVPCAVAVERIDPLRAIQRLVMLLIQRPGGLLLQFAVTLYFGVMMVCVLVTLAVVSLGPTLATNGPSLAGMMPALPSFEAGEPDMSGLFSSEGFPGMEGGQFPGLTPSNSGPEPDSMASGGPWGDWLRKLGIGVVVIAVFAFPVVFWICAFARYYETLVPSFSPTASAPLTPVMPPPLPGAGV